jgi:hypothetical protein
MKMEDWLTESKYIWFFLLLILGLLMVAGEKVTNTFLWVVLASMVILNAGKVIAKLQRGFN